MARISKTIVLAAALLASPGAQAMPPVLPPVGPTPGSQDDFRMQSGSDTIYFESDSARIRPEFEAILTRQAAWLKKYPNVTATIEGHSDERGERMYLIAESGRRADAVKDFLVKAGIAASRLSVVSYGKERQAATGSDEESWAQNRRAVVVVSE